MHKTNLKKTTKTHHIKVTVINVLWNMMSEEAVPTLVDGFLSVSLRYSVPPVIPEEENRIATRVAVSADLFLAEMTVKSGVS